MKESHALLCGPTCEEEPADPPIEEALKTFTVLFNIKLFSFLGQAVITRFGRQILRVPAMFSVPAILMVCSLLPVETLGYTIKALSFPPARSNASSSQPASYPKDTDFCFSYGRAVST